MSMPTPEGDPLPVAEIVPPRKKGIAWLAWIVIVLAVVAVIGGDYWRPEMAEEKKATKDRDLSLVLVQMQARYLIGVGNLLGGNQKRDMYEHMTSLDEGSPLQRLCFVVMAGEMAGPDEALGRLDDLLDDMKRHADKVTPEERRLADILDELYEDQAAGQWHAPSLNEEQKEFLRNELGWFGKLALAPKELEDQDAAGRAARTEAILPAYRTFLVMIGAVMIGLFLGICGLVTLIVLLLQAAQGKLQDGIQTGLPHAGVYAEMFALWLVVYLGLSFAVGSLPIELPRLLGWVLAMLSSLVVLVWPVLRGIPWSQVRQDLGWTSGRQPALEPALGIVTYVMSLPFLGIGIAMMIVMLLVQQVIAAGLGEAANDPFAGSSSPIQPHPLFGFLQQADWSVWLQVFLLASVVAPIVEETMFRGALYRHVREATRSLPLFLGMPLAALLVSFIFAAVHPTGLIAVPPLMALALGFTVAREWRGTLIPCMIAHGLSNGLVMSVAILALAD